MLKVTNIQKNFNGNHVLKGIDFEINKGEVVAILGPSGSGKTTFLRCLNLLERPEQGKLVFTDGDLKIDFSRKITKSDELSLRRRSSMVFQQYNLFPHLSVRNNIVKTLKLVKKIDTSEAETITKKMLDLVGLSDKMNSFPNELSGGQKQRVAIARALALQPDILLFDEPTSALDPELVKEVLDIIRKLKEQKITMLIVSHEMNFVREISDRVVVMEKGKILETGTSQQIFENPSSQRVKEFLNTNS